MEYPWLELAQRLQAIAQAGLTYTKGDYDRERYEELRDISVKIMADFTDTNQEEVRSLFANRTGYQTPNVDVRAVVLDGNGDILLVREREDSLWAMPGGWADIGYSPSEVAVKEVREESGYEVEAQRILAVLDKKYYPHPPEIYYTYKIFIACTLTGGSAKESIETSEVNFFNRENLPPLSPNRNLPEQVQLMFKLMDQPDLPVAFN